MPPRKKLTQQEVADLLGLTTRQVFNLTRKGMPSGGTNGKRHYLWDQVLPWYVQFKQDEVRPTSNLAELEVREQAAKTESAEIDLRVKKGQYVPIEYSIEQIGRLSERLGAKIKGIGSRHGHRVVGLETVAQGQAVLNDIGRDLLATLADTGEDPELDEEEGE